MGLDTVMPPARDEREGRLATSTVTTLSFFARPWNFVNAFKGLAEKTQKWNRNTPLDAWGDDPVWLLQRKNKHLK